MYNNKNLTSKQNELMLYLWKVGSATIPQLNKNLGESSSTVNSLLRRGLIMKVRDGSNSIYFLTYYGFRDSYDDEIFEEQPILPGMAEGLNSTDYYSYINPIRNRLAASIINEFENSINGIKNKFHGILEFKNNRFAEFQFPKQSKLKNSDISFNPSGVLVVNEKKYLIEVEISALDHPNLKCKFKKYTSYFKWLKSINETLPAGIIFLKADSYNGTDFLYLWQKDQEDFKTLYMHFLTECKMFRNEVQLLNIDPKVTVQVLQNLILEPSALHDKEIIKQLSKIKSKKTIIKRFFFSNSLAIKVTNNMEVAYFLILRCEGSNSFSWVKNLPIYKKFLKKYPYSNVICCYYETQTVPPIVELVDIDNFYEPGNQFVYYLDLSNETPLLYDNYFRILKDLPLD